MFDKANRRPTVLLTGFGPFPGVPVNASANVVGRVVRLARRAFPEFRLILSLLPTEWRRAPRHVAHLHNRYRPILALHFGVASGARSIRLETQARNVCRALADAADQLPISAVLSPEGPVERPVTIDIPAIADALASGGWPCSISNDAGGYLCNAVLYQSLASAEARGGCVVGFAHIPTNLAAASLAMEEVIAAALEIIKVALNCTEAATAAQVECRSTKDIDFGS